MTEGAMSLNPNPNDYTCQRPFFPMVEKAPRDVYLMVSPLSKQEAMTRLFSQIDGWNAYFRSRCEIVHDFSPHI
jgi:hypothetical protein